MGWLTLQNCHSAFPFGGLSLSRGPSSPDVPPLPMPLPLTLLPSLACTPAAAFLQLLYAAARFLYLGRLPSRKQDFSPGAFLLRLGSS